MNRKEEIASKVVGNQTSKTGWLLALGLFIGIAGIVICRAVPAALARSKTTLTPEEATRWAPLGFGLDNFVTAMAVNGNDLYAAGTFIKNICGNPTCDGGNIPINRIAKWDGTQWSPLGFGFFGVPTSIVINSNKVYVTGVTKICSDGACSSGTTVQGIAVWDGGSWSAALPALDRPENCCLSTEFLGRDMYVGGTYFLLNGGVNPSTGTAFGIAKLSVGSWAPIPRKGLFLEQGPPGFNETQGQVASLFALGNDLYAGGFFDQSGPTSDQTNDPLMNLRLIAVLSGGTTWQPLPGQGLVSPACFNAGPTTTCGSVSAFAAIGTDLYVGGAFNRTFDGSVQNLNGIAKFDTNTHTWSALPNNGLNSSVGNGPADPGGLATRGTDLFAIGAFTATADNAVTGLNGIAWLHNGTWLPLGNGFAGSNPLLLAIAVSPDNIFVGGRFSQNGDGTALGMNNIARLAPVSSITTQLEVTKTANPNPAIAGENLTYTIVFKNQGADTAKAVTLTDPLAGNVTFVSASITQGNCTQSNGSVTCNVGDVPSGLSATATIVVVPNAAGNITNIATVSAANAPSVQGQANTSVSASTGSVQFNVSSLSVNEGDQRANITVNRSGDTTAAGTIDYATSDTAGANSCNVFNGAASSRCDYLATLGTLHFAAGETSKIISVPIIDDTYAEGSETFTMNLSNALGNGMGLGSPVIATITINDNDTATGVNPIDNATFFVRQHYLDFLNREPDQSGWDFWTNNINNCTPQLSCTDQQRINTSGAFFLSIEFQQTGYLVYRIYKASFGNLTSPANAPVPIRFAEFLPDTEEIGNGVVVNQGNWQQQLESNKQAFTLEFVQRSRFSGAYPTTLTPAQFVDQLFSNAGVTPSSSDRQAVFNEFGSASDTSDVNARSRALREVAENSLLQQQEFNRAFVLMQYFGYLRRNPYDSPDADYSGYDFWLSKLNSFNGDFTKAEMVKAFINSAEYRQRFGSQ